MLRSFLRHLWISKKWNAFHSPYLFRLFQYACNEKEVIPAFKQIEEYRKKFLSSKQKINRTDKGAGSKSTSGNEMSIGEIARSSVSSPFQCRFMARLVKFSNALTIVELGSSLGISTAYLGSMSDGKVYSVEGDPILSSIAQQTLQELNLQNVHLATGTFENFIQKLPQAISSIDILFIDGDHRKESLLKYYEGLAPKLHTNSIVIVDDIHWSSDMEAGWNALITRREVTQSVDCFYFGLLFFKQDFLHKEHHTIRLPLKAIL